MGIQDETFDGIHKRAMKADEDAIPLAPMEFANKLEDPENPAPQDLQPRTSPNVPATSNGTIKNPTPQEPYQQMEALKSTPPNATASSDDMFKFLKKWLVMLIQISGSLSTGLIVYLLSQDKVTNGTIHGKHLVSSWLKLMVLVFLLSFFLWILANYLQGRFFKALLLCAAFATIFVSVAVIVVATAACF